MMTCERISGIEGVAYLHSLEAYAAGEKKGMSNAALDANVSVRNIKEAITASGNLVYAEYLAGKKNVAQDQEADEKESQGTKLVLGEAPVVDLEAWKAQKRKGKTPPEDTPAFGQTGEVLSFEEALSFAKGYHPTTGKSLIKHVRAARTVGYDLQFALPKSYSVMWGLGASAAHKGSELGKQWKDTIEEGQRRAVRKALEYAHANGLIIARRSGDKFGHEGAGHVVFGQYEHKTSREGDPQVHTHNMLFNVCIRADGTTGTLDNKELKRHAGAMAALYRMEFVSYTHPILGVSSSKVDRNCEMDGVPEEIISTYSKRTEQIGDYLDQFGIDDTAMHREAAKYANKNTRKDKSEQPPLIELYGRWDMEASAKGWRFESLVEAAREAAEKKNRRLNEEWVAKRVAAELEGREPLPVERPEFDLNEIKARAYSTLIATNSVFEERRILKEVFEELQTYTNADTAIKAVDQLIASGDLVRLEQRGEDMYFTTAEIIATEQRLIRNSLSMTGNLAALDPATVERFIRNGRVLESGDQGHYKGEQAVGIRHACGPDQISVIQGRAGAGKSFMLAGVADIHRALGREVHAIAPSHKAKEVVANDAQIAQDMARAVAGFINDYGKGKIAITANSTIILDEGGTLGLDDMDKLVQIAKETGARLIISGDTRQLQPVAKGAPMAILSKPEVCGCVVLGEIVRQKDPRQREASVLMSEGKIRDGFQTYINTDRVKFSETALSDTRNAYLDDIEQNPNGTRMMGVFRNAEASKLNLTTREELKDKGYIASEGWKGETWTRGLSQRVVEKEFVRNERIIFGESFKIGELEISNNTTATILRIDGKDEAEPTFTIRTDDGRVFSAKPSEMVGYRDPKANDKHTPKIDYAYAQTVYSLQGSTFDRMFVFAGEAGNAELAYVMMTRHKLDCRVFVDKNRIHDELAATSGKVMTLNKKTGGAAENHTEAEEDISDKQIAERFLAECQKSSAKLNACDFHDSIRAFVGDKIAMEAEQKEMPVMDEKKQEDRKATEQRESPEYNDFATPNPFAKTRRPMPRGMGDVGYKPADNRAAATPEGVDPFQTAKPTVGEQVREQAAKMGQDQKPKQQAHVSKRISKEDMDRMGRFDLVDYFVGYKGFEYVEAYTPKNGVEAHILRHTDIGKVSVKKNHNGVWNWTTRAGGDGESGAIWDFAAWRKGTDKIRGMHSVREELGMTPTSPRPLYSLEKVEREASPPPPPKTMLDRIKDGGIAQYVFDQFKDYRERWSRMAGYTRETKGVNAYLESRGITAETQRDFKDQIGTEHRLSRLNPHGAAFAHRDLEGNIWNYERKGPKHNPDDERSFSQMGKGTKRLGLLGDYRNPTRIYVAESSIDGLSLYQKDGRPQGALIASTFGNPSDEGYHDLYRLMKEHPKAEVHVAMDNDKAGRAFAEKVEEVAGFARGDQRLVVDRRPAEDYKDWNDEIQGLKWNQKEKAVDADRKEKLEAERAQAALERAEQEAERRRRKEEYEARKGGGYTR